MNEVKNKHQRSGIRNPISIDNNILVEEIEQKPHLLIFPYQGDRGNTLVKTLQKRLHNLLPNHINTQVTYRGKKLSTCFNIKDQTKFEHQHDIVYHGICPEGDCIDNYEHVYVKPEMNSNWFEISNRFEKPFRLHDDFAAATFQTVVRFYYTCVNDLGAIISENQNKQGVSYDV